MSCNDCTSETEHCHDVLVLHADGADECPSCGRGERAVHDWRQPCAERCCAA